MGQIKLPGRSETRGTLMVNAEEVSATARGSLLMQFSATNVDKKDFFGKHIPCLYNVLIEPDGRSSVLFLCTDLSQEIVLQFSFVLRCFVLQSII